MEERHWELVSKYLSNNITLPETEELLAWVNTDKENADMLKELQEVWERSHLYDSGFEPDTGMAWQKIQGRLNEKAGIDHLNTQSRVLERGKPRVRSMFRYAAVAAAVLIFTVFGVLLYRSLDPEMVHVASADTQKKVLLPDGSAVWLNANSEVSFAKNLGKDAERKITLNGEAFFEVQKDAERPFTVQAGETEIRVLGTSFNIKEFNTGDVSVAVMTGKVSFKAVKASTGELILLPGEGAKYSHKGYLSKSHFNNTNFMYWKDRKLEFNNEDLKSVLGTLSEIYQVKFRVNDPELLQRYITTSFEDSELTQVLNVLEVLLDVSIDQKGTVYEISRR